MSFLDKPLLDKAEEENLSKPMRAFQASGSVSDEYDGRYGSDSQTMGSVLSDASYEEDNFIDGRSAELSTSDDDNVPFLHSKRAALAIVFTGLAADYLLVSIIIPIIPVYLKDKDVSQFKVGLLFASKGVVQIMANPLWGWLTIRIGSRIPLFTGLLVLAFSTFAFAFLDVYEELLAARAVQGFGSAAIMTAGMSLISCAYPIAERGKAFGTAVGGIALGVLLGPPVGGLAFVSNPLGKGLPFVLVAVVLVISAAFQILSRIPSNAKPEEVATTSILTLLRDSEIRTVLGALVFANFALACVEPLISPFLVNKVDVSEHFTGLVFMSTSLSYGISADIVTSLGDRFGRLNIIGFGLVMMSIALPVISLPRSLAPAIFSLILLGICMACVDASVMPTLANICDRRYSWMYGAVFALSDIAFSIGFVAGPFVSSALFEHFHGFFGAMCVCGGLVLLYVPVFFLAMRGFSNDADRQPLKDGLGKAVDERRDSYHTVEYDTPQSDYEYTTLSSSDSRA